MKPPSGGPMTGPTSAGTVTQAMALTSALLSMERSSTKRPTGVIIAPPAPCTIRAMTADHENGNRETEYHPRAEAIGGPSARWYEHREGQQVGGNGELERQGAGADIGGDRGKRCRNHRRIHVFHEQGSGHDQRDQTFFFHGDSGARWLAAGARAVSSLGRAGYCGTLAST